MSLAAVRGGAAFSPGEIADYLSGHLGGTIAVNSVRRSFPGASRETWLVSAHRNDRPESFVLRVDPPEGGGCPGTLRQEFGIYEKLARSEIPVAEPLWYNEGHAFASGRPHMVRRMVEGSSQVAGLFGDDDESEKRRRRVANECIDKLAMVHRLDWRALGLGDLLPEPANAGDSFRAELMLWRQRWLDRRPFPSPVVEEAFAWLAEWVPTDTPRISLVKGNNGLGEEIWRGETIVAMSDWELACLGDGISDLFWSQGTVRLIGFDEVLRRYEAAMGQSVSPHRLTYANVFALIKQFVAAVAYWYRHFHDGQTIKPYAFAALSWASGYEEKLARCLGRPIDEVWSIISGGEKAMYLSLAGKPG